MQKILTSAAIAAVGLAATVMPTLAAGPTMSVTPWTYDPGNACSGIQSTWDSTTGNPPPALHLTKPCLTATNASSGATINGVNGITLTELNYDIRSDSHCGAGAPRFNVVTSDNVTHFIGCAAGTTTGTTTDTLGNTWIHKVFNPTDPTQAFPVIAPGTTVQSIDIVFDEGTDQGNGYAYLDNISVNGANIGGPNTPTSKDDCKKYGYQSLQDNNGQPFKNQGQCVSYFNHL